MRVGAILLILLASGVATAQQVTLRTASPPHYAGEAIEIHVVAEGFDEDPTPLVQVPAPTDGMLVQTGVQPNVSTQVSIINGQFRRTKEVQFAFIYQLTAAKPGKVTVGPFTVLQGSTRLSTGTAVLDLQEVPTNDQMRVGLSLPATPVYVGERVPVTLRFVLSNRLRENLHQFHLRAPFFGLTESFQFLDPPDLAGTMKVEVQTPSGSFAAMGHAKETKHGREDVLVVEVRRIAVPLRAGELEIPGASLDVEEGVRFRRDFFGGRQATQVRRSRTVDQVRRLVVKRIPTAKMPASFAGAVGTGFSLAVSADRTVVQVGEPITLHLELRGSGNLETAALPPLDAEGLLPATRFRVPDVEIPGRFEESVKRFTATVRVKHDGVREIPALEYAWFDPKTEKFETTQSRPIALSVGAAQVVGAADVQSGEPPTDHRPPTDGIPRSGEAQRSGPLVLTGADLAIERDVTTLLRHSSARTRGPWLIAGMYLGSLAIVLFAQWDRRRRSADPAVASRRRLVAYEIGRLRGAANLPAAEAAAEVAGALRALLAEIPEGHRTEIDELIGECDAQSYAPTQQRDGSPLDPEIHGRALKLARQLTESR
jgi:hypothetical protein